MLFGGGYVNDVLVRDTLTTARVIKNKFDLIVFCCGWAEEKRGLSVRGVRLINTSVG